MNAVWSLLGVGVVPSKQEEGAEAGGVQKNLCM